MPKSRSSDDFMPNPKRSKRLTLQTKLWLVNTTLEEITDAKLPLNQAILKRFLFIRNEEPLSSLRSTARIVYNEVVDKFWGPSRIPMKPEKKCLEQIEALYHLYEQIRKTPIKRRDGWSSDKIRSFLDKMQSLCDLSHARAEEIMEKSGYPEWTVDRDFLLGQRKTPQIGSMDGVDNILRMKEKKKLEEEKKREARKSKETLRQSIAMQSIQFESDSEEEVVGEATDAESSFEDDHVSTTSSRSSSRSALLEFNTRDLITKTSLVAERCGVSRRVHLFLAAAFVKAGILI